MIEALGDLIAAFLTHDGVRPFLLPLLLTGIGAVLHLRESLQKSIRVTSSQKAVAIDMQMDESQLAKKLNGKERLTAEDIDRLPVPVQQHWHLLELVRLGLPDDALRQFDVLRVVQQFQQRSA